MKRSTFFLIFRAVYTVICTVVVMACFVLIMFEKPSEPDAVRTLVLAGIGGLALWVLYIVWTINTNPDERRNKH